jgi:hypothetical protein
MKKLLILTVVGALIMSVSPCRADIPHLINYQGMLTDTGGNPLNGDYDLTFKIYGQSSGGSALWTETHTGTQVQDGLFNVILGSLSLLPSSVFEDTVRYLGITVGSDPEVSPRIRITSIPYAYRALVADSAAVAGSVVGSGGGWVDDGNVVRLEDTTDNVGIGMTNPSYKLDVTGEGDNVYAIHGKAFGIGIGMHGESDSSYGVYGVSSSSIGVYGESDSSIGVYGYSRDHLGICGMSLNGYGGFFVGEKNYFLGNVGIGTIDPGVSLHIDGGSDVKITTPNTGYLIMGSSTGSHIAIDDNEIMAKASGDSVGDLYIQYSDQARTIIYGKVGIGTKNPAQKLDVNGIVRVRSWGSGTTYDVKVNANGDLTKQTSSRRYNENIRTLEVDPDQVLKLSPVRFDWKETQEEDIGLIAEDVEQTLPDLVIYDNEGRPDAVKYDKIAIYLLGVVKNLKTENEELKKRIETLESRE